MPAELSILTRFACEEQGCDQHFRLEWQLRDHARDEHGKDFDRTVPDTIWCDDVVEKRAQRIKCSFSACKLDFDTMEQMVEHKIHADEHDFCPVCPQRDKQGNIITDEHGQTLLGVDCKDWADFVKHKIMSDEHLCCPICGKDFKSQAGVERHIKIVCRKM